MKSAILAFLVLFALLGATGHAQNAPKIEWQKVFGGNGSETAKSVKQTIDGGYIIGGQSTSGISGNKTNAGFGGGDYWIVKLDASGAKQFDKCYGTTGLDDLWSLQQTSDGGYILGGDAPFGISGNKTNSGFGAEDFWVVKVDSSGNKQWDKCYGGNIGGNSMFGSDNLRSLQQTSDGGYILGGMSESSVSGNKTNGGFGSLDFWVVKTDSNGVKQWDKSYGGTADDAIFCVHQTSDGGYIFGGGSMSGVSGNKTTANFGSSDYWVVKTDVNGIKQWDKTFGGSGDDTLRVLIETAEGGYLLGGYSYSGVSGNKTAATFGASDYWIVKIDSGGNKEWEASFGGTGGDGITSIQQTAQGGYVVGGGSASPKSGNKTDSLFGAGDFWTFGLDALGTKTWESSFGGSGFDELWCLQSTRDGGLILAGSSASGISGNKTNASFGSSDFWVVKLFTPLSLTSVSVSSNLFQAKLLGVPGTNYILQASTNLISWLPVTTNTAAANGIVTFSSPSISSFSNRFYRAQIKQ